MNTLHLDMLSTIPTRRHVLRGLTGLGLGLFASMSPADGEAKKRKKKRKGKSKKRTKEPSPPPLPPTVPSPPPPPPTPNQYGCFSVGVACTSAAECCTGVCEGGICRAHGTGNCNQEAAGVCLATSPALVLCNFSAKCFCIETTGGSKFCGTNELFACSDCVSDTDCVDLGFPAGTACAPFSEGFCKDACQSGKVCIAPCGTDPEAIERMANKNVRSR